MLSALWAALPPLYILIPAVYALWCLLDYLASRIVDYFVSPLRVLPTDSRQLWDPWYKFAISMRGTGFLELHKFHMRLGPVVRVKSNSVSMADPELVHRVLKTEDLPKADFYDLAVPPSMVPSVFNSRIPAYHRVRRKLHSLSFSLKYLSGLEPFMIKIWDSFEAKLGDEIDTSPSGEAPVNLCKAFNAVTNDVIGSTAFGQSFNSVSLPDRHPLVRHTAAVLEGIIYYILIPPSYKYWRWFPVAKSIDFVRTFVSDVIRQRKDLIKEKGIDAAPQDILQNLIMAEDAESGTRLNEEEVLSESLTLLVAGADTTSHTLSWTCYLLARNPQYIPLLLAELATVTLENNRFSHNQLKNLPLLNAIISEGLRLFPVAGTALLRKVGPNGFVVPFNGSDVVLAEGTELVIPIWTLHRSPAIWQRAEEFWPERWFVDDLSAPVKKTEAAAGPGVCRRDSFFPFSEGSRDCIGKNFAWQELRILLAHFVWAFDFRMADPEAEVQPRDQFVLAAENGRVDAIVRRRRHPVT